MAIIAPSSIVRAGLEALVRSDPGLAVAGVFADPASLADTPADVVLAAPGAQNLADLGPAAVLLTDDLDPALAAESLASGFSAVLPADAAPAELLAAIRAAAAGLVVLRRGEALPHLAAGDGGGALSPRELEVLRLLAQGLPNKSIAFELGISEHTVKFHVASILNRLNAASRAQAVAIGIRRGLIMV